VNCRQIQKLNFHYHKNTDHNKHKNILASTATYIT
jgi:hypothetical protein